ncbi:MAG: hypothetical protein GF308_17780 [Candidatus Heimdallarchaeota archaeon]|nr:hypothetical protein [Candidatus Heimdallarchaeota archaeon]
MTTSKVEADIHIGKNHLSVNYSQRNYPVYTLHIDEEEIGCHWKFIGEITGWKPGNGQTKFGKRGYFAWTIPLPKAKVKGTIRFGTEQLKVNGFGYHDHNWGNFALAKVIDYWYWGRIYSDQFTLIYAYIQCNKKMNYYPIKVLMLANNNQVILSTGEYQLFQNNFQMNKKVANTYPGHLTLNLANHLQMTLTVEKILDAENLLADRNPIIQFLAKHLLNLHLGYFRFTSHYELTVSLDDENYHGHGTTLHEMVILK